MMQILKKICMIINSGLKVNFLIPFHSRLSAVYHVRYQDQEFQIYLTSWWLAHRGLIMIEPLSLNCSLFKQ